MGTSSSEREIRVALIGYGLGGACFHAPLIAATAGMRLTTIVTSNPDRQAQAQREHPGARVVASADMLWQRAAEHDVVVISTTNSTHVPLALAALQAGLPVVIDKPFAPSEREARRVIEAAQAAGLWATAYHIRRWDSESLTLRRLMDSGALGRVLRYESRLERWRPEATGNWRERGDPLEAGGLLYDLGSHLIDQALHLFGPVSGVYAEIDRRRAGVEADDDVFLALTHASGVRSHLWTSYMAAQPGPRLRVLGDRATFVKEHADIQESALRTGKRPDQPGWGEDPPERWGVLSDGGREQAVRSEAGAYQVFYERVIGTLRNGTPLPVDPQDAVAGLRVIEAAQRSARERSVVMLTQ